jgi:hypothetical protein
MYDSTCAERTESNTASPANALISSSSVQPVVLAISARTPGDCKRIGRIRNVLGLIAITSRPLALSARLSRLQVQRCIRGAQQTNSNILSCADNVPPFGSSLPLEWVYFDELNSIDQLSRSPWLEQASTADSPK